MGKYKVEMQKDKAVKYYYILNLETYEVETLPTKYLTYLTRANRSPNTIRRCAFSICWYMKYLEEKQMGIQDVYVMDYETQFTFFSEYLHWMKSGNHKDEPEWERQGKTMKLPDNGTCNAYLKDVFRFYSFLEQSSDGNEQLSVLSYSQMTMPNAIGVRRTIRVKAFKGYLKAEERNVRAAQKNEILTILEACTNCRDQLLILMISELGFRIGEILGVDYAKDIDYECREVRVDFRDDNENDARAKNAEERSGKLSKDTFDFLMYYMAEYWDLLQHQNYLFINIKGDSIGQPMKVDSVYDMLERMEKKTGIKITPHMLRRHYANTRWEAGWPLELLSQTLGHKHLDTTIRYLNVIDNKIKDASREFYERHSDIYGIQKLL